MDERSLRYVPIEKRRALVVLGGRLSLPHWYRGRAVREDRPACFPSTKAVGPPGRARVARSPSPASDTIARPSDVDADATALITTSSCTIHAMEREVRYCTSDDGTRIAYCVEGEGPPLVITPYLSESFSLHNLFPSFADFMREVASGHIVIRYDTRGTGLSQRVATDFTLDALVGDLEAVVDAAGLDTLSLFGSLTGALSTIAYAYRHPDRVKRLAIYCAYPGVRYFWTPEMMSSFCDLARANWPMAVRALADISLRDVHPEKATQLGEMLLQSMSGENGAAMFMASYEFDLIPFLPELSTPILIVHRVDDGGVPFRLAQEMAAAIPNARLVPVPGKANNPAGGDPRPILDAIGSFFDEDPETRRQMPGKSSDGERTPVITVLFTDLVGHAEMMSRLGDERGRDVLREHERITREVLKANGGTEVKTMGDGFMASFGSVTKAVECAVALQRAFADHKGEPLSVRVGLNAGEPIEEDGDLFGATVILASRIAAKADGGEILVADTVRGLCSGKGFLFSDRGEFVAKGFEEPVRISEVSWRS
jgi:class 3 adenylate cyclase/pimeloyl-ACP methyl ester carboxylesterase